MHYAIGELVLVILTLLFMMHRVQKLLILHTIKVMWF
jgi:hypothetical protein